MRVAVIVLMSNMKITMETVYQGTTAPVSTVVKSSGQERLLKPTVKNGNATLPVQSQSFVFL